MSFATICVLPSLIFFSPLRTQDLPSNPQRSDPVCCFCVVDDEATCDWTTKTCPHSLSVPNLLHLLHHFLTKTYPQNIPGWSESLAHALVVLLVQRPWPICITINILFRGLNNLLLSHISIYILFTVFYTFPIEPYKENLFNKQELL